jgi:phospholipid/cholesterol/gamma-HCH transport system ATP-binding protein
MIEVVNLSKSFKDVQVLSDISVFFEPSMINLIIGKSGSGKTVLLKSIIGLHEIDSGDILFNGRNFTKMNTNKRKEIRKEIGMLFQGSALFDSATLEENVRFPLDMFTNMTEEEKIERANFCLKRVQVENKNNLFPSEISGGMQKRVALARAIALNPKYLFCDEPNSGLDPYTAIVIDNLIKEITLEYNMTTIINTHDMNSVIEIGDKIVFISKGKKGWEGRKEEIWHVDNESLNELVFASELSKKVRELM